MGVEGLFRGVRHRMEQGIVPNQGGRGFRTWTYPVNNYTSSGVKKLSRSFFSNSQTLCFVKLKNMKSSFILLSARVSDFEKMKFERIA